MAHNNFGFDSIVLENNLYDFGIDFPCNVYFADSITIMKHLNETIGKKIMDYCLAANIQTELCVNCRVRLQKQVFVEQLPEHPARPRPGSAS